MKPFARLKVSIAALAAIAIGACGTTIAHAQGAPTQIVLQGAANVRDLGGYQTYDGATVKSGKIIRSDALGKLTAADVQKLGSLNLQQVIDFRTPAEVQGLGADVLPSGVPGVARAIDDTGMFLKMSQAIGSKDPAVQQQMLGNGAAEQIMAGVYKSFFSADSMAKFGQTVKDLAATKKATLFHCTAGKDRTGWLSYVVLQAVGVPEAVARQDYLLSNQYRAAADAATRQQLQQAGYMQNPDLLIPLQTVSDQYLDVAVQQMQSQFGDLGKYLTKGLGVDPATVLQLRKNLVS